MIQSDQKPSTRERRVALKLSERQLAEMAGVSRTSVRKAESGFELTHLVQAAIDRALDRAEAGGSAVGTRHGLYYVTRDGGVVNLTADEGVPLIGRLEGSLLRALLGYALDQCQEVAA